MRCGGCVSIRDAETQRPNNRSGMNGRGCAGMKHASSRQLYEYWSRLRGNRMAPERSDIDPSEIRQILGNTFILEVRHPIDYVYRLAGTRICSAYCRELKGQEFLPLWPGTGRRIDRNTA